MNYSVIIVTYNRRELLEECISCVLDQTLPFDEVIIIDNNSTDQTREYLKLVHSNRFTKIRKIHTNKNVGGAGGFSVGLKNVGEDIDYVLLIDDDAMLDSKFLDEIDRNRKPGIEAYSGTVKVNGQIDLIHRRRIRDEILLTDKAVPGQDYRKEGFFFHLASFCGLMISTELLNKIGFPRTDFFIQYDDTEYSHRIRKWTGIYNVSNAVINHKTRITAGAKFTWKNYYIYRNQWYVGLIYSKRPKVYNFYRWTFHHFKYLILFLRLIIHPKDCRYYINLIKMQRDVLKNVKAREMGINEKYQWGTELI